MNEVRRLQASFHGVLFNLSNLMSELGHILAEDKEASQGKNKETGHRTKTTVIIIIIINEGEGEGSF